MARRVVHASNAAAPCPATIRPYQIFLWRAVSYVSVVAGFTGVLKLGWMAEELAATADVDSSVAFEDTATLGVGASGLTSFASTAGSAGAGDFSSVAAGVSRVRGVSTETVLQQISRSAVIIKDHLSHCRPGEGAGQAATSCTLLYQRTGVTGPLVMFSVVLDLPSSASLVLVPGYQSCLCAGHGMRKNCYNPAR